jgi:hypothetical protein
MTRTARVGCCPWSRAVRAIIVGALVSMAACNGGEQATSSPPPPSSSIILTEVADFTASTIYAIAGGSSFTLFADGSGFAPTSVLQWNGTALPTTFGTNQILMATVSGSLIALPGTAQITARDASSGEVSNALPFGIASPATATAGVIALVSVAPDGSPANGDSLIGASINSAGRYLAFQSNATNLAPGPASGFGEIYERDTCIGAPQGCSATTIRITVTADGSPVNAHSRFSAISADGRYVAFDSQATNILPETQTCGGLSSCVFLRDTCIGSVGACSASTTLISVAQDGSAAPGGVPAISANSQFVAFDSNAPNIVSGDTSTLGDVFIRNTCDALPGGCTPGNILVSVSSAGTMGNGASNFPPATDPQSRFVAFQSNATNLVSNDTLAPGIFLRDTCLGAPAPCTPNTARVDVTTNGVQANNGAFPATPSVSDNGRLVAFASQATNLVSTDVGGEGNVYVRDTCAGAPASCTPATSISSLANDGSMANCPSPSQGLSLTPDGRFVAFDSIATNLVPGDTFPACGFEDVFIRDTCFGAPSGCVPSTVRVSVVNSPFPQTPGNSISGQPAISADGHYVVFLSAATNLVPGVTGNGHSMVYLAKTGF